MIAGFSWRPHWHRQCAFVSSCATPPMSCCCARFASAAAAKSPSSARPTAAGAAGRSVPSRNAAPYGRGWLGPRPTCAAQSRRPRRARSTGDGAAPPSSTLDSFWASDPTAVVDGYGRWAADFATLRRPSAKSSRRGARARERPAASASTSTRASLSRRSRRGRPWKTAQGAAPLAATPSASTPSCAQGNTFGDTYAVERVAPCASPLYFASFARLLAAWGVDFLKLDAVSPGSGDGTVDNRADVDLWSRALEASGRDIWLTISWHINASYAPDFALFANGLRTS